MPKKSEKPAKVTRAEWDVLEALWSKAPLSAREVFECVQGESGREGGREGGREEGRRGSLQTVRTLLDRLLVKGVVKRSEVHGVWVFAPAHARDKVVRDEGRSFLSRFFDGRPELGAAYFIENENLPQKELERLRKLVNCKLKEARDE
jgi:Predicted transcriptional regulator